MTETIHLEIKEIQGERFIYGEWTHSSGRKRHIAFRCTDVNGVDIEPYMIQKGGRAYKDIIEAFGDDKIEFDSLLPDWHRKPDGKRDMKRFLEMKEKRQAIREKVYSEFEIIFSDELKEFLKT